MSPRRIHLLLAVLALLPLVAAPAFASEAGIESPEDAATTEAPACDGLATLGLEDPLPMAPCFVSVMCADESTVSCNGNSSCSTSGPNGRCVTCDGVQEACCSKTCCENCEENLDSCLMNCGNPAPSCNLCYTAYNYCVNEVCGGCP